MAAVQLNNEELHHFETLLKRRRNVLIETDHYLEEEIMRGNSPEATGELSSTRFHDADTGSQLFDRQIAAEVASLELRELREVDAALERIHNGTYGICMNCEERIQYARLEVVPETRYCRNCIEEMSAGEQRIKVSPLDRESRRNPAPLQNSNYDESDDNPQGDL